MFTVTLVTRGDYSTGDYNDELTELSYSTREEAEASWLASEPGAYITEEPILQ